jgi:hypothetical protein
MTPKEHAEQLYNIALMQIPEEENEKYGHDHWLNVNKELLDL